MSNCLKSNFALLMSLGIIFGQKEYLSNENASVISFTRLKVGEDIVIESKDFAEEVAEQLK